LHFYNNNKILNEKLPSYLQGLQFTLLLINLEEKGDGGKVTFEFAPEAKGSVSNQFLNLNLSSLYQR
jgi:predicted AlkP superfamily phosphohydrolase/phosphomutase